MSWIDFISRGGERGRHISEAHIVFLLVIIVVLIILPLSIILRGIASYSLKASELVQRLWPEEVMFVRNIR